MLQSILDALNEVVLLDDGHGSVVQGQALNLAERNAIDTALLAHAAQAAFAVPVRRGVFEDERGVHVSMVNPLSVERTIVAESGLEASGRVLVDEVAGVVAAATHGRRVNRPYGQSRSHGTGRRFGSRRLPTS